MQKILLILFLIASFASFAQKRNDSFDDAETGVSVVLDGTLSSDITVPAIHAIVKSYVGDKLLEESLSDSLGEFSSRIEVWKNKKSFLVFYDSAKTRELVIEILINDAVYKNKLYKMTLSAGFSSEYQGDDVLKAIPDFYLLYSKENDFLFVSETKDGTVE